MKQVLADVQAFARRPDFDDDVCVIGVEVARSIGAAEGALLGNKPATV
jgi:hypothetical protein